MEKDSLEKEERGFRPPREVVLQWQAPEYFQHERTPRWYLNGAIFLIIIIVSAFFLKNILMAVVFILIGVMVYLYSKKEPRTVVFSLMQGGIEADGVFYDFSSLRSFWIFYNQPPHDAYISIRRNKKYLPFLQIPLGHMDPSLVRGTLLKHLKEKKHQEEFSNIVEKYFKL